jgi:fibronectin-binding autotransporter adhesin
MMRHFYGLGLKNFLIAMLVVCICILSAATSRAAVLYWNSPTGGNGDWDTVNMEWATISGGAVDTTWNNAGIYGTPDDAIFENTAGTVSVQAAGITAQSLTFNTANYVISDGGLGGVLTLAGITPTVTANSNATINAVIGGASGLTKAGGAQLTLGAGGTGNTYTGDTTITAGTLLYSNTNQLSAGGTNNIVFNGAGTLGTLAGVAETRNITMNAAGTIDTWGFNSTFSGVISGGGALTKAGNGTLTLSVDNGATFSGQVNLNGGSIGLGTAGASKIVLGNANALGTGTLNFNGGTIENGTGGALDVANPLLISNSTGFAGNQNLTFTSTAQIKLNNWVDMIFSGTAKTVTFNGQLANGSNGDKSFVTTGTPGSTLVLAGGIQTRNTGDTSWRALYLGGANQTNVLVSGQIVYNGSSTNGCDIIRVGSGIVTFASNLDNTNIGSLKMFGGTTVFDYTTGNASKLWDTGQLRTGGVATLDLQGAATAYTEVVGGFNGGEISNCHPGVLHITRTSGLATVRLNALSINQGGLLDVQDSITDTDQTNTNGILAPGNRSSVTVGRTDWAYNYGIDGSVPAGTADGQIRAYTNYNVGAETTWDTVANNGHVQLSGSATLTDNRTTNTLKIVQTNNDQSLDLGTKTYQLNNGGVLFNQGAYTNYEIKNGTIKGGQTGTSDLLFITNSLLNVSATIANGNSNSRLTKAGTGTLLLAGANTYTGTTYPLEGVLQLGSSTNVGTSGPLGTGVGDLYMGVGGTLDLNGYNVTVGRLFGEAQWEAGGYIVNNSGSGVSTLTVGNGSVGDFACKPMIADYTPGTAGGGKVAVEKIGTRLWTINAANTFSGGLTVSGGTIRANNQGNLGLGKITFKSARIYYAGSVTETASDIDVPTGFWGSYSTDGASATLTVPSTITVGAAVGATTAGVLDMRTGKNGQTYNFTGDLSGIAGDFVIGKTGGTGTHYYNLARAGATQGSAGMNLQFGNTGTNTSVLRYNGATTGAVTVYVGGIGIYPGATSQYATLSNNVAGSTATFEIGGRNNITDAFAGVIENGAGTTAVTKAGTGTLTLTGANTYTGATTVNNGTLIIQGTSASLTGIVNGGTLINKVSLDNMASLSVNNGGTYSTTFAVNGESLAIGSTTAGGVTVQGGGTINMLDTKIGTLNLNSPAGSTLTVGSGGTGPSILNFDFSGTAIDLINLSSNLTVGANGATINVSGISGIGSFPLISFPSGVKNGTGALTLVGTPPTVFGLTYSLDYDTHNVYFKSAGDIPLYAYWRGNLNSEWNYHSGTTTNWTKDLEGATPLLNALPGPTTNVYFAANNVNTGSLTQTLGQDMAVLSLNFNTNVGPTRPVTINGSNNLTIGAGGITIDSGSGAHTIATSGVALNGSQLWINNSTSAFTVDAPITGGDSMQSLSLYGSGMFIFKKAGTYASSTNVDYSSSVRVGDASALGTGSLMLNGRLDINGLNFTANNISGSGTITNDNTTPGTIIFGGDGTVYFSGSILDGTGAKKVAVSKIGTGTLSLYGTNAYTGGTAINGGMLSISSASALGATGNISFGGGTLQYSGVTTDYSARIKNSTAAISIDAGGQDIVYASDIDSSNVGGITIKNSGATTFTLSGNNSYTGTTTIVDGTVKLGSSTALSTGQIDMNPGGATLDINGYTLANNIRIYGTNSVIRSTAGTAVLTGTVTVDQGASPAFYIGAIGDTGNFSFDRIRHTGGNNGYLVYQQTTGTVTLGGTLANDGETAVDIKLNYNVADAGTVILNKSCSTTDPNQVIGVQAADSVNLAFAGATLKYGPNTTTGRWKYRSGQVSHIDSIAGTFIDLSGSSGVNSTVNNLRGLATVRNSSTTAAVIGVGAANDDLDTRACTFDGIIEDGDGSGGGGKVGLSVVNPFFTFTLTNANTYTGVTNITGKLVLATNPTTFTTGSMLNSSEIRINAGSTFDVSAVSPYTTGAGQTISGSGQVVGTYIVSGGTVSPGLSAGTLTFASDLTITGSSAINTEVSPSTTSGNDQIVLPAGYFTADGTVNVNVGTAAGYVVEGVYKIVDAPGGAFGSIAGWTTSWDRRGTVPSLSMDSNSVYVTVHNAALGHNLNWAGTAGSPWDVNTTVNWYNNTTSAMDKYLLGDNATFADTYNSIPVTNSNVTLSSIISPASVLFNNSAVNYAVGGTGQISGTTGLVKSGTGSLTLNNVNTYSGDTTVNGGTLILNVGGATGSIRSTLNVNATGAVSLTAVDALGYTAGTQVPTVNVSGVIDNATTGNQGYRTNFILTGGSMTSTGGGKFNFSSGYGVSTLASPTTSSISSGILIRAGATLNFNVASGTTASGVDLDVSGIIEEFQGTGGISKSGTGKLSLSNANLYTGATTVNDGVLELASTGQLLSTSDIATTATSATFMVNGGTHLVDNISGIGNTELTGAADLTATSVVQGTLTIGAGAKLTIAPLPGGAPLSGGSIKAINAVPEPSTWAMLVLAAMGLGIYWRRSH